MLRILKVPILMYAQSANFKLRAKVRYFLHIRKKNLHK